ncbi:MAG: glycoside hydrolase family 88 protein [Planctomycetota bacterium]
MPSASSSPVPSVSVIQAACERIAVRMRDVQERRYYTWMLAVEGIINFSTITGDATWRAFAEQDIAQRNWQPDTKVPWREEPFVSLSWAWANATGDPKRMASYVEGTRDLIRELPRTPDNLITHPRGVARGGGNAVLLDSFQEYAGRMARAAKASGDSSFITECVDQVSKHRALMRDPTTGLWCQGRGWLSGQPMTLSPGTWSRGQGWLLRGLSAATEALPRSDPAYTAIRTIFIEAVDAACARQQPSGMWHALPHRPATESGPEASGTAFIAAAILRAIRTGVLPATPYRDHAWRAISALVPRVDANGMVHDACPGPGPLEKEEPWLVPKFPPGDVHGSGTMLEALVEALRMSKQA